MMNEARQYDYLENTLQAINGRMRLLRDDEDIHNSILEEIFQKFVTEFKKDKLFKELYENQFFAGSYWSGLKIIKPDEYDVDLQLRLPKLVHVHLTTIDSYVTAKLDFSDYYLQYYALHDIEKKLCKSGYLDSRSVLSWMESLLSKAVNAWEGDSVITFRKTGPALTLNVFHSTGKFDVDLVPSFKFGKEKWPGDFRRSKLDKGYLIVPKYPDLINTNYFRLSFAMHEDVIILNRSFAKPAIRLLKLLVHHNELHLIKSYFIKTVCLFLLESEPNMFDRKSLSFVFVKMFQQMLEFLKDGDWPYYWKPDVNLMPNRSYCYSVSGQLERILRSIKNCQNNPEIIRSYFEDPSNDFAEDPIAHDDGDNNLNVVQDNNIAGIGALIAGIGAIGLAVYGFFRMNRNNNRD